MMLVGCYDFFMYKIVNLNISDGGCYYDKLDDDVYNKIINGVFIFCVGLVYLFIEKLFVYGLYGIYFKFICVFYDVNIIYIDKDGKEFIFVNGKEVFKLEKGFQVEVGV